MEQQVIGATGVVIVATRGIGGPGEVSLRIGGASDSYLAWSEHPLARGIEIVVTDRRGPRTVEVEALDELELDATGDSIGSGGVPPRASDPLLEL